MRKMILGLVVLAVTLVGGAQELRPSLALFVQNRSANPMLDAAVDSIRERLAASIAGTDAVDLVDPEDVLVSFNKSAGDKTTGFGATKLNMARQAECDYIATITITQAKADPRPTGVVHYLDMTLRLTNSRGRSVACPLPQIPDTQLAPASSGETMMAYNRVIDRFVPAASAAIANSVSSWRPAGQSAPVDFAIETTVPGATVALDDVVIGSAPGIFKATPGIHRLRITRDWMTPFEAQVSITANTRFTVALEMSAEGIVKWGSIETLKAETEKTQAEAASIRRSRVNIDTSKWNTVRLGGIL